MTLSTKLYNACLDADLWRTKPYGWSWLVRQLVDRGFYGIAQHETKVVCFLNGVRFEL